MNKAFVFFLRLTVLSVCWLQPMLAAPVSSNSWLRETPDSFSFHNEEAVLVLERQALGIRLQDAAGKTYFSQSDRPAFLIDGKWVSLAGLQSASLDGDSVRLQFKLSSGADARGEVRKFGKNGFRIILAPENRGATAVRGGNMLGTVEEIYGFGEMWNGRVAQRGQSFDLWDKGGTPDECAYMPYYVSTANYAFFLNYGGSVRFDVGQKSSDRISYEAPTGELDITLVRGESIASTVKNFLSVIGLPARPPRWSFKPWFWLMSDPDQPSANIDTLRGHHSVDMVKKLHAMNIPVGVTWFEPPWQDARSSFIPNPAFSPDFKALNKELEDLGVRALAWTVPYTTKNSRNWQEAVDRRLMVQRNAPAETGDVKISTSGELVGRYYNMIDLYNPEAFAWWQAQIDRSLETGIRGFKLDAGQDLEADALLHGGRIGRDVHNSYATEYSRVFFESLTKKYGDDFLMIPRAAWMGSSAYTNFKWPGDLSGSFANNGLPSSVYSTLSLAFSGFPFVSTDIGGFEDRPAPEHVWLRWAQFGAMLPGMQTLHMPWWYSKEASDHFRYLSWLHTDLIPLWMTLANEAAATGAPVCRPLVWSNQKDIDTWRVDDQFTVGTSLLVAPMLNANPERSIYLPEGLWYDFWDETQTTQGPARVTWFKGWNARTKFPLYIKEGAIIPMEISNAESGFGSAESAGFVTLAMWPMVRGSSEFVLHDTEAPVRISAAWNASDELTVSWSATKRNHLLRMHLNTKKAPAGVTAGGQSLKAQSSLQAFRAGGEGWFFDAPTQKLWVKKLNDGREASVRIVLN
ncbi:glycoside hydrolase family 31 protein [Nibricoccus aquaticus]|nr:glycoside hydrolase family 31 protein [Nibricoccus aquaticus]